MTASKVPLKRFLIPVPLLTTVFLALSLSLSACGPSDAKREGGAPQGQTAPTRTAQAAQPAAPTIPAGPPAPPPLISKPLEPSASAQTLSWNDKVTVTIPGGLLNGKQTLAIAPPQDVPPPTFKAIGEMAGYTITLGDLREFKKELSIDIAYDPAKLPDDLSPQKALFASYWDPGQKLWVYTPITVDAQRKVVTIKTNHLTTWKVYYILRGYGVKESDHFLVIYDKQTAAIVGSRQVSASPFANDVSGYLEQAYKAYAKAGFTMPSGQTHAFVDKDTQESQRSGLTGNIYFAMTHDSAQTLMHEAAHELFHVVQNGYYNVYGMGWRGWWTEATADFAAYQVVWNGGTELSDMNHTYFNKSITAHDGKHEYMTANFVAFLARRGMDFKGAWDAVADDGRVNVLRPLETYVQGKTNTSLHSHFRQFVRYALFDPAGPVEQSDKELMYSGMIDKPDFLEADQKNASYTFSLGPDYTAAVWGLRVRAKDEKTQRLLHMEIVGTPPPASQVQADVVLLRNDARPQGGASPRGTLDASNPKMDLRVVKDDVVYIVAVNSSGGGNQIAVKITVEDPLISINPDSVTLAPRGSRTFIATVDGKMPGAGVLTWSVDEGTAGGNVTNFGRYTAPNQTGTYHVTATLASDKMKKATATITVSQVALNLRPMTATVAAGGKQAFTAEVTGNPETRVTWKVEERDGGTVTAEGVYTAPSQQGTYHVIATSRADPSQTARVTVSVIVPTPTPLRFTLALFPSEVVLLPGAKQEFRASLLGLSDTRVRWDGFPQYVPAQNADKPMTFTASDIGDYTVSVTSVADPTKRAVAKVKVVPGVWVFTGKTETKFPPNIGMGVPNPTGSVSLSSGSATATNQTGSQLSKWSFTWTEPPTSLSVGQKFKGTVSTRDAGSKYDPKAWQFPSGSVELRVGEPYVKNNSTVVDAVSAGAGRGLHGDQAFTPSNSTSSEFTAPKGRADSPTLNITARVVAQAHFGEGTSWTQLIGEVRYKYELRPIFDPSAVPTPAPTPTPPPKPQVSVEFTYPVGQSPKVFTEGWALGAKATLSMPDGTRKDVSDSVVWSGDATFSPSKGSQTKPTFNRASRLDDGPRQVTISVEAEGVKASATQTFQTVNPRKGYARLGDKVFAPAIGGGSPGAPFSVTGFIASGSPTVMIGGFPTARVGDVGAHCCSDGANNFNIASGDSQVLIDGKPAARKQDKTLHDCSGPKDALACTGAGTIVEVASETMP